MDKRYILAIDQRTQGTKAMLLDEEGAFLLRRDLPHRQLINDRGWVGHDMREIAGNIFAVCRSVIADSGVDTGAIAAVAVVPEYRHRGLGSRISRFLVKRILEKGKTPRLISGYDEVAELYRQVGFETCGRWGELYL